MGKMTNKEWALIGIALLVVAYIGNVGGMQSWGKTSPAAPANPNAPPSGTLNLCPAGIASSSVTSGAAFVNPQNSSAYYTAGSIVYTDANGKVIITDTATGGATANTPFKSTAVGCNANTQNGVYLYAVASSTLNSAKSGLLGLNGASAYPSTILQQSVSSALNGGINAQNTNLSVTDNGLAYSAGSNGVVNPNESAVTTIVAGGSRGGYFNLWESLGSTEFGGPVANNGVVFSIQNVNSSVFGATDISLNGQNGLVLTDATNDANYAKVKSFRNAMRMYTMSSITAAQGYITVGFTLHNGGGMAVSSLSNPVVYVDAVEYFTDTDSVVKYGTVNSQNSIVGPAGSKLTFKVG